MPDVHQFRIELLGTSFVVRSSVNQDYFNRILRYLENSVLEAKERTHVFDPVKIALLSSINIIDELLKEKEREGRSPVIGDDTEEMERITQHMIAEIDEVI